MSRPAAVKSDAGAPPGVAARALHLVKTYGSGETAVTALRSVDIDFPAHRFTAIMGPSGSGKSTLMHCLAGLDTVSRGQVFIGDVDLSKLSDKQLTQLRRDRIGFVFQQFNLLPTLTAAENITLPLDIAGRKADPEWMRTVVTAVGLGDRLSHRPTELSGGQQQRVACARALVTRPDIVFADEPTGNLDSRSGAEVLAFLRRSVREFGQTIVMVTHDPTAASYADQVVFLADGRIVDWLDRPTPDGVLERMKYLDQRASGGTPAPDGPADGQYPAPDGPPRGQYSTEYGRQPGPDRSHPEPAGYPDGSGHQDRPRGPGRAGPPPPQYDRPQYDRPQYERPQYDRPDYAPPGDNQPTSPHQPPPPPAPRGAYRYNDARHNDARYNDARRRADGQR